MAGVAEEAMTFSMTSLTKDSLAKAKAAALKQLTKHLKHQYATVEPLARQFWGDMVNSYPKYSERSKAVMGGYRHSVLGKRMA